MIPLLYYGKKALKNNNHIIYHSIFRYIGFWNCCFYVNYYSLYWCIFGIICMTYIIYSIKIHHRIDRFL